MLFNPMSERNSDVIVAPTPGAWGAAVRNFARIPRQIYEHAACRA